MDENSGPTNPFDKAKQELTATEEIITKQDIEDIATGPIKRQR